MLMGVYDYQRRTMFVFVDNQVPIEFDCINYINVSLYIGAWDILQMQTYQEVYCLIPCDVVAFL